MLPRLRRNRGQGLVEYALILALIAILVIVALNPSAVTDPMRAFLAAHGYLLVGH
jgi:Flp pilus assembly pilin Flp